MKVAIMQPYFFPYLGQFQLIHATDRFILGDDVQYIQYGWINRNRVLKAVDGVQYVIMPLVKHSSRELIQNIKAVEGDEWKIKLLRQLEHYKKKSPFYANTVEVLKECFSTKDTSVTDLNSHFYSVVCQYLGIDYKVEVSSRMNFDYAGVDTPGERVISMCKQIGATAYLNPPGGTELYDRNMFDANNIGLGFVKPNLKEYNQQRPAFEPGLSIIDVMMFNSVADIKIMLNDFEVL